MQIPVITLLVLLALSASPSWANRRPNFRQNYEPSRKHKASTSTESKMKKGGVFWKLCAKQLRVAPEDQARCVRMMGKQEEKIKRKVAAKVNRVKTSYQGMLETCQKDNQALEQNRADNERWRRESEQREILLLEKSKTSARGLMDTVESKETKDISKELAVCEKKFNGLKTKYMTIRTTYKDVLENAKKCGSVLAACRDKYNECANHKASFPPSSLQSSTENSRVVRKVKSSRDKKGTGAENLEPSDIVKPPIRETREADPREGVF